MSKTKIAFGWRTSRGASFLATASGLALLAAAVPEAAQAGSYNASDEASLKTAIANANADPDPNATITLTADITFADPATTPAATKPITIATGGFDLIGATINSSGDLSLTGGGDVHLAGSNTLGVIRSEGPRITVTGQGTTVTAPGASIGQNVGMGAELWVTNGGQFTSTASMSVQGGPSVVTVDGAGSILTTAGATLGVNTGSVATLNVQNGGTFRSTVGLTIGGPGGTGTANIIGQGSLVEVANTVTMATSGNNATLNISQGGQLRSAGANIGAPFVATTTPSITVSGPGSLWAVSGNLNAAVSNLSVLDGGALTAGTSTLGGNGPRTGGALLVSGSGSTYAVAGAMSVGSILGANVTVADGGSLSVGGAFTLGQTAGFTGVLNIGGAEGQAATAAGSVAAPAVTFGPGVGRINFNHTDQAYEFGPAITGAGAINQVAGVTRLTGNSSTFTGATTVSGGELRVDGALGTGGVTVNGGALSGVGTIGGNVTVNAGGLFAPTPGAGTLTIGGALALNGGAQTVTGHGAVGGSTTLSGGSSLQLQGGGTLTTAGTTDLSGGTTLGVSGAGSVLTVDQFRFGSTAGTTTVNIENGGVFRSTYTGTSLQSLGTIGAAQVNLTITGAGSLMQVDGQFAVASPTPAAASVKILDGGALTGGMTMRIGSPTQAQPITPSVLVSGAGSSLTAPALILSQGSLDVLDGGRVNASSLGMGGAFGSAGLRVSGAGSSVTSTGALTLNGAVMGAATLADGGVLNVGGPVTLAGTAGRTGVLNIGGTEGQAAAAAGSLNTASLTFGPGTGRVNFNHTDAGYAFGAAISGAGAINQVAGDTTLTGDSSGYTGVTTISGGALKVNGTLGGATSSVAVNGGGTLGGSGTIGGDVAVADGAILSPGNSPGTLTINGDLTLSSGSVLDFEFGQAGTAGGALNDLVVVGGALTLDGTLNLAQSAGGAFGPGLYRLFDYAGALTDNGLDLGSAPAGTSLYVQTAVANQVNLINNTGQPLSFWDGPSGAKNDGAILGGSGTWRVGGGAIDWTAASGAFNGDYDQNGFAVFTGTPGTVTIDNTGGAVGASGLQFAVDGYTLAGGDLTLTGPQATIRVGEGTSAAAGMTATIASAITGASQLVKTDGGRLVLTAANSYTGGTAMNGGVLQISSDANLGAAAGGLSFDGGTLQNTAAFSTARAVSVNAGGGTLQTDADLTLAGATSGAGGLTKAGAGALVLTGDAAHTGGTVIQGGVLQIGDGGTAGSLSGNVSNNSRLVLDRSDALSLGGAIAGTGSVEQRGAGTATLSGVNSYSGGTTIAAGTLRGSATSFGSGAIRNDAALLVDQPTDGTMTNAIDGAGTFTKAGAGRLAYAGVASLTGPTTVAGGTLAVNGSLAQSAVEVRSGAGLGGDGTVGATIIRTGGSVAPGNSIGVLNVAGAFVQEAGSTYQVEVDPNSNASDRIAVSGTATVAPGAVLNVAKNSPGSYRTGAVYHVLSASGGLSGTYALSGETAASAFLGLQASYDPNNAYLTVVQTAPIGSVAETPNQGAVAGALPPGGGLETAILNSPTAQAAQSALAQLSGDGQAAAKGVLANDSRLVRDLAVDRLRDILCAEGRTEDEGACPNDPGRAALWGQAFGAWGSSRGQAGVGNVHRSTGGFLLGMDLPVKAARLGWFAGYSRSNLGLSARSGNADVDAYHLGAYGGTQAGPLGVRFGAAYSWQDISTTRQVVLPGLADYLRAQYDAGAAQAFGEVGYRLDFGPVAVEPFLNAAYVSVKTSAFDEWGGIAALSARSDEIHNTFATLGARPSASVSIGSAKATIRGLVGWRHAFGEVAPRQTVAFQGGPDFVVQGAAIARDAGVLELGADVRVGGSGMFSFTYGGQYSDRVVDQSVRGQLTFRF